MGSTYDLERMETNFRCNHVKPAVVIINYIFVPFSLIFMFIGIFAMILQKKRISFLTQIILFIFSSEILNSISKLLQILKYAFKDTRMEPDLNEKETPRGRICQAQIVFSIISDFCSLLGTFIISYRCNEVIKSKNKRIFNKKIAQILVFVFISCFSIAYSIIILYIDKNLTKKSLPYKYDIRDRCSYWCWLEHTTSRITYVLYLIILLINIIYACKTYCYLRNSYNKLYQESIIFFDSYNENNENGINNSSEAVDKKNYYVPKETGERMKELNMIKIKCLIYPWTTNIIWILSSIYRLIDDFIMFDIDDFDVRDKSQQKEEEFFNDNPGVQTLEEVNLVLHTLLSSARGLIYGISFIVFEEKVFGDIIKKYFYKYCCFCCFWCNKMDYIDPEERETENEIKKNIITPGNEYLMSDSSGRESKEEDNSRKSNASDLGKNYIDMNTSDYY